MLKNAGTVQSMSRKGNYYDNAVMENSIGHRKEELFHRVRFLNTDALTARLSEYIRWCNTERISTKLEGLSPVQYRAQALAAKLLFGSPSFVDQFNISALSLFLEIL